MGLQGLPVVRLPAPFVPHSASLGPAKATRVLSALVPVSAPPTSLDECLFFISLVSDFLAVRFSVSSGCTGGAVCLPTLPSWFSVTIENLKCYIYQISDGGLGAIFSILKFSSNVWGRLRDEVSS